MAQDIFQRDATYGGAFPADKVKLSFGSVTEEGMVGAVVQSVQLQYQQQITRLYELGSGNFYYIGGRASGEAQLSKVLGPGSIIDQFIQEYGDICSPQSLQLNMTSGCGGVEGNMAFDCAECVMIGVGVNVQANDVLVNQNARIMIGYVTQSN